MTIQPWKNKSAMVGGGSTGLGFEIAKALAQQNAKLCIIGRDKTRLERARTDLMAEGASQVFSLDCDMSHEESVQTLKQGCEDLLHGRLDLAVNAVGRSDRGWLRDLDSKDLMEQFESNVLSSLHLVRGCWDSVVAARGVFVHIGSLSSKIGMPGMGGYSVTKFGLAALNQQLRRELAEHGAHSLLVCPGPIQRSDTGKRYEKKIADKSLPAELARPGGGANLRLLLPDLLAQQILVAAYRRKAELVLPSKVRWLVMISEFSASWGDWILRRSTQRNEPR